MVNMNMAWAFHILPLFLLYLSVGTQGSTEFLTLHNPKSNPNNPSIAVSLPNKDLEEVASSVLMAETWLRTHVLSHYPSSKITHIVLGHNLLCLSSQNTPQYHLILPALNNLYHSLTRWGLASHIKLSPSLSSHCLSSSPHHFSLSLLKPLLHFLHSTNSTYLINPLQPISSNNIHNILSPHLEFIKKIQSLTLENINLVTKPPTFTTRKLSSVIASGPLPPLIGPISSPPSPFSVPHLGLSPTSHSPHHHNLPPCNPWAGPPRASPGPEMGQKLWCVAKPSVPAATLQEAMDYACGEGGADCDEIQPNGNCYFPDSLVAHASYAFNSYWQKSKKHGGTCGFGGTAMLINSDPSYLHCRFIVI